MGFRLRGHISSIPPQGAGVNLGEVREHEVYADCWLTWKG